jgi:1,4-dihydroxy-2-naphthoate octaprenyltransferase
MQHNSSEHPGIQGAWLVAIRPASLPLALGPVVVGAAMGFSRTGSISVALFCMAVAGAMLMQILTNLQNDIGFTERGGEHIGQRRGLPRATARGWLSLQSVRLAIVLLCGVAVALGVGMVMLRGWQVLAIGGASLVAALAYMGGPKPIAYTPLGELTVFVFFGLVAVMGTDWLLTDQLSVVSALSAVAIGCLSAAALAVNNHRDREHDALVGRKTFAVLFGTRASMRMMTALLACPFVMALAMAELQSQLVFLLPLVLTPVAKKLQQDFCQCAEGVAFNAILFRVFRLEIHFAFLLAGAAVLSRVL